MLRISPIISALNAAGVSYVVVGGVAVALHGFVRATADLDLVLTMDEGNLSKAIGSLTALGLQPRPPVRAQDFIDPKIRREWVEEKGMVVFSLADPDNPFFSVDIFVEPPLPLDELLRASEVIRIENAEVRVCSLEHLIEMKSAIGRPQDVVDVETLRQIRDQKD